jgi:sigma-E factor negative regulatory protein RseA
MKSKISALMDGELDAGELHEPLAALHQDAGARDAWRTYHLISDALQGRALMRTDCLQRVAARLAQEPVPVAAQPSAVRPPQRAHWFVPSALAASVAAVALVAWMAFAPQPGTAPVPLAQAPAPAAARTPLVQEPPRVQLTSDSRDYLLAHQAFSPRNALLGMAPYVRSVSGDATARKP